MKNVTFGNYDAYLDFSLIRTSMEIGTPKPKTRIVDIEGADGEIDLTEYFGDVNYNNRQLTFEFETIKRQDEFMKLFSIIQNAIHGKRMKVQISDDPDFYYIGRITVSEWKADKRTGKLTIEVDAEPYKLKNSITTIAKSINGTEYVDCYNLRKRVSPTVTVEAETTLEYGSYTATIAAGIYTMSEIIFTEGENLLKVTTNGLITITYQEGGL